MNGVDVGEAISTAGFSDREADSATSGLCGTFALALKSAFPGLGLALLCLSDREGEVVVASDGDPMWKHALATDGDRLYDIGGEVALADLIENYCWDNPRGKGGVLFHVDRQELEELLRRDGRSFDESRLADWSETLVLARTHLLQGAKETFSPRP